MSEQENYERDMLLVSANSDMARLEERFTARLEASAKIFDEAGARIEQLTAVVKRLTHGLDRMIDEDVPRCHCCACCEYIETTARSLLGAALAVVNGAGEGETR